MKKWIITGTCILGILSSIAFKTHPNTSEPIANRSAGQSVIQGNDITAIINKDTSANELEDLKTFFAENGIELIIKNVAFNDQDEITSLSIILKKGTSKSKYSSSSNTPISEIELGYKNDNLYITNSGMFDINSWRNQSSFSYPKIDIDSLLKKHNFTFNFDFDDELDSLDFKGHFDMQKFKDKIMKSFIFESDEDGNFIINGKQFPHPFKHSSMHKYSFIDNPDIEKLIIIDGKESDFETLDNLAKSDKLAEVDFLKPVTATSIYGDKAKDGAIIAITKE